MNLHCICFACSGGWKRRKFGFPTWLWKPPHSWFAGVVAAPEVLSEPHNITARVGENLSSTHTSAMGLLHALVKYGGKHKRLLDPIQKIGACMPTNEDKGDNGPTAADQCSYTVLIDTAATSTLLLEIT